MYCNFDEEVLLCPEGVVADVVASAAFDDELELTDLGPFERCWRADAEEFDADGAGCEPRVDATRSTGSIALCDAGSPAARTRAATRP